MNHTKELIYSEMSLSQALEKDTIKELKEMAVMVGLSGYSKLRKNELVEAISDYILDEERVREALMLTKDKELTLLSRIRKHEANLDVDYKINDVLYFLSHGLFTLSKAGEFIYPVELDQILDVVLNDDFYMEHERIQLIYDYTSALVKLYGIVTVEEVVTIFNEQNEEKTTKTEVKAVYKKMQDRGTYYELKKQEFIHETVLMSENSYDELVKEQQDKPKYIPQKEELIKYSDDVYIKQVKEYEALKVQMIKYVLGENAMTDDVCDEIQVACSLSLKLSEIMGILEHYGVVLQNVRQVEHIVPYIVDLYNNTRMWNHCGHTPLEISKLTKRVDAVMSTSFGKPSAPQRVVTKIGRNDMCPCGSGKKYKHCCGR